MEYINVVRNVKFIFLGKNIILIELPGKSLSFVFKLFHPHKFTAMREHIPIHRSVDEYISDLIESYHQTGERLDTIATKLQIMDDHYEQLNNLNFLNLLLHKTKPSNGI